MTSAAQRLSLRTRTISLGSAASGLPAYGTRDMSAPEGAQGSPAQRGASLMQRMRSGLSSAASALVPAGFTAAAAGVGAGRLHAQRSLGVAGVAAGVGQRQQSQAELHEGTVYVEAVKAVLVTLRNNRDRQRSRRGLYIHTQRLKVPVTSTADVPPCMLHCVTLWLASPSYL